MIDNSIHEPFEEYNKIYKNKVHDQAIKYFDELVAKNNVSYEENKNLVKKYDDSVKKFQKELEHLNKYKGIKTAFIIFGVILIVVAVFLVFFFIGELQKESTQAYIPVLQVLGAIVSLGLGIFLIVFGNKKYSPLINQKTESASSLEAEKDNNLNLCYQSISRLLNALDWNMQNEVIVKAVPLIQLDKYFDIKKFQYLNEKYGFYDKVNNDQSVLTVQSGSIVGNPFLIYKTLNTYMGEQTYYGSRVITYYTRDSKGRMVSRSQTLTASVTKPCPMYYRQTELVYANDAAPKLSFRRVPSGTRGLNEKQIERLIKERIKDFEAMTDLAIKNGKSFTRLGNDEFESLFGAIDRTNEVDYRLLFTPLAQQNLEELIRSQEPFGDDFEYVKQNRLNYIYSKHSQEFNYEGDPKQFINHDLEVVKNSFLDYCDKYFANMFFDLCPIISIPMLQQYKSEEYIYKKPFIRNYCAFETESLFNEMEYKYTRHKDANTDSILKTRVVSKDEDYDNVILESYSYQAVDCVDYIPVRAMDGHVYDVPVHWKRYDPLYNETSAKIRYSNMTKNDFKTNLHDVNSEIKSNILDYCVYKKGLAGVLLSQANGELLNKSVDLLFNNKKEAK